MVISNEYSLEVVRINPEKIEEEIKLKICIWITGTNLEKCHGKPKHHTHQLSISIYLDWCVELTLFLSRKLESIQLWSFSDNALIDWVSIFPKLTELSGLEITRNLNTYTSQQKKRLTKGICNISNNLGKPYDKPEQQTPIF